MSEKLPGSLPCAFAVIDNVMYYLDGGCWNPLNGIIFPADSNVRVSTSGNLQIYNTGDTLWYTFWLDSGKSIVIADQGEL